LAPHSDLAIPQGLVHRRITEERQQLQVGLHLGATSRRLGLLAFELEPCPNRRLDDIAGSPEIDIAEAERRQLEPIGAEHSTEGLGQARFEIDAGSAEEVVDAVCGQLRHPGRCSTSTTPLPGARADHDGAETPPLPARIGDAVRRQWCVTLEDFLLRRTTLGFAPDRGAGEAEAAAQALQGALAWSEARRQDEIAAYLARAAADRRMWPRDRD